MNVRYTEIAPHRRVGTHMDVTYVYICLHLMQSANQKDKQNSLASMLYMLKNTEYRLRSKGYLQPSENWPFEQTVIHF